MFICKRDIGAGLPAPACFWAFFFGLNFSRHRFGIELHYLTTELYYYVGNIGVCYSSGVLVLVGKSVPHHKNEGGNDGQEIDGRAGNGCGCFG